MPHVTVGTENDTPYRDPLRRPRPWKEVRGQGHCRRDGFCLVFSGSLL
ncbi:MAG: hypothetical protein QOD62_570 [Actinomycetota bacterium]|nr:hypothetical protein [Actinomycetota bacterium]